MNKLFKRILLLGMTLCMMLCIGIVAAACDDDDPTPAPAEYSVTLDFDADKGSVTKSAPASGDKYAANESVTITVTPKEDYEVTSFKVDDVAKELTDNKFTFAVTKDVTVKVVFGEIGPAPAPAGYSVTLDFDASKGNVTKSAPANGDKYAANESVTITVAPNANYHVASFKVDGVDHMSDLNSGSYTFAVTKSVTVAVVFEENAPGEFSVELVYNSERGSVTMTEPNAGDKYADGTSVTITVVPGEHYEIESVTIGNEAQDLSGSYTFSVTDNVTVTVVFTEKFYTVTTSFNAAGGNVTASTANAGDKEGNTYRYGASVTVAAAPNAKYHSASFKVDNVDKIEELTSNAYTFSVAKNVTVEVVFEEDAPAEFSVTLDYISAHGSVTMTEPNAGDKYVDGTSVTITVVPGEHYVVKSVTIGGVAQNLVPENTYTFSVTDNVTVEVVFEGKFYTVSAFFDNQKGNVTFSTANDEDHDGNTYRYGASVTVTFAPASGFELGTVSLSESGSPLAITGTSYTFTVDGNVTFYVTFDEELVYGGSGTATDPEVLRELVGTHSGSATTGSHYYYTFREKVGTYYTFISKYNGTGYLYIKHAVFGVGANGSASSVTFRATNATTTTPPLERNFYIPAGDITFEVWVANGTFSFTVEEYDAPAIPIPWTEGDGTADAPYVIDDIETTHNVIVSAPVYFKFTATADMVYTFSSGSSMALKIISINGETTGITYWDGGTNATFMTNAVGTSKTLTLAEGDVLIFTAQGYSTTIYEVNLVTFEVEGEAVAASIAAAPNGIHVTASFDAIGDVSTATIIEKRFHA